MNTTIIKSSVDLIYHNIELAITKKMSYFCAISECQALDRINMPISKVFFPY